MHGGTIEAESEGEGHGATFRVKLPIPAVSTDSLYSIDPAKAARSRASKISESSNLAGVKVLAIDDSKDTRELVTVVLERCGANVATASSVREALEVFAGWKADVLVCDIGMPDEDGYSFIRRIRRLPPEDGEIPPPLL
jgi:PleD family two-component response regulator